MVEGTWRSINMDRIFIKDLMTRCVIGTNDWERELKQDVIFNIELEIDLAPAARSDNIEDTINYKKLKQRILAMVEDSEFYLIEKLADEVAGICLEDKRVKAVVVSVDKPGALRYSRSVGVKIRRENSH